MGIFDALSGGAYKTAAKNNNQAIQQGVTAGANALTMGANNAIDSLGTRGAGSALAALGTSYNQARNDLTAGFGAAQPALERLGTAYDPMVAGGQNSFNAYLDAIGANGAEGNARAASAFQAAPGRSYAMDQVLEAVQRTAAARGGLAGGNATADILKTANGIADQSFNQYVTNLQNGAGFYTTGLAGQSQGLGAQANAAIGQGSALAALGQASGRDQAGIFTNAANVQSGLGQNVANIWAQATQNQIANNNQLARAQTEASGNLIGGILGGASGFLGEAGKNDGVSAYLTKLFK